MSHLPRKAVLSPHFDVERLELRRLLSTTSVPTVRNDWTSDWTSGGGDGEALSAPGNERDSIGDVIDIKGDQLSLTLTLPKHSMIKVIPIADAMNQDAGENATVTCSFGNTEITLDSSQLGGPDYDDAVWQAHSGTTLDITLSASDFNLGITAQAGAIVYIYNPTITATGGGALSESGNSNGIGFGSGTATFTVTRDLPDNYDPLVDDALPETHVTVKRGGSAEFTTDYVPTNANEDPLPDGEVTIDGYHVSESFVIKPVDDAVTESLPTAPVAPETITWEVTTGKDQNGNDVKVLLTANITDDAAAVGWTALNTVPGQTSTVLDSQIEYAPDDDPLLNRGIATWQIVETYEAVGAEHTSVEWGDSAHISGSIGWSDQLTTSITIGSASTYPVTLNIGRTQGVTFTSNYNDTIAGAPNKKSKTVAFIMHRKFIKVIARQYKDTNGNWVFSGLGTTLTVLAEGDVAGQWFYQHSKLVWRDEEAST